MKAKTTSRKIPEVNLLTRQAQPRVRSVSQRSLELALIAVVLVIWGGLGVAVVLLLGWRPQLGLGP